jgi:hypothetical protein
MNDRIKEDGIGGVSGMHGRREIHKNLNRRDYLRDRGINGSTILK